MLLRCLKLPEQGLGPHAHKAKPPGDMIRLFLKKDVSEMSECPDLRPTYRRSSFLPPSLCPQPLPPGRVPLLDPGQSWSRRDHGRRRPKVCHQ